MMDTDNDTPCTDCDSTGISFCRDILPMLSKDDAVLTDHIEWGGSQGPWKTKLNRYGDTFISDAHGIDVCGRCLVADNARAIAEVPAMVQALRWIADNYENQYINHVDFRVEAKHLTDAILDRIEGKEVEP